MINYDRKLRHNFLFTLIAVAISSSMLITPLSNYSFAHTFAPNESAQFLALMQLIKTQAELVETNLNNNNIELAIEHANAATNALTPTVLNEIAERNERVANELSSILTTLESVASQEQNDTTATAAGEDVGSTVNEINAIIGETITVRIDQEQRDNITIQALAFANVIDEILANYGDAYTVGFDMTNVSNMAAMGMDMDHGMGGANMMNMDENTALVNVADYQTAQALAQRAHDLFTSELRSLVPTNASSTSISNLEEGLSHLTNAINNKAFPMEVMMIVHSQVHPNLQTTFNLTLEQ